MVCLVRILLSLPVGWSCRLGFLRFFFLFSPLLLNSIGDLVGFFLQKSPDLFCIAGLFPVCTIVSCFDYTFIFPNTHWSFQGCSSSTPRPTLSTSSSGRAYDRLSGLGHMSFRPLYPNMVVCYRTYHLLSPLFLRIFSLPWIPRLLSATFRLASMLIVFVSALRVRRTVSVWAFTWTSGITLEELMQRRTCS